MRALLVAALFMAACEGAAPTTPGPGPGPDQCEDGTSRSALEAVDRKIVGDAAPYVADGTLRGRDQELARSQRARREVAWQTVGKVLTDVPLAEALPNAPDLPLTIPTWQSWYDLDDVRRVFHRLYGDLTSEERAARTHFTDADLDEGFAWNVGSVDALPTWPHDRYLAYLAAIDDASKVAGVGGISRVQYSPAAARQLMGGYPEELGCLENGAPPAHVDGPVTEVRVIRSPVTLGACGHQSLGSFSASDDEVLRATLEDGDGARVTLRSGEVSCTATAGEPCEVAGPATFEVTIAGGAKAIDSFVDIDRATSHPQWAACLTSPFPIDAAVVKADWRRAQFGKELPFYSTSGEALSGLMASADVEWAEAGEADPGPNDIYTLTLPNDTVYRLAALHIMTKELDHWLWITLWWSPSPDDDFGADRPASLAASGPWKNYKMCVSTAFSEEDPDPGRRVRR